jgi:DNA-binding MarR family transcriptional regulator
VPVPEKRPRPAAEAPVGHDPVSSGASPARDLEERADAAASLAVAVGRINRRIRPQGAGLSQGQLSALSTILRKGPLRPGDLARIETIGAPSVTRLIADLQDRGLVERRPDPDDGRSCLVSATAVGEAAVLRAREERARKVLHLLGGLDDERLAGIHEVVDALEAMAAAVPEAFSPTLQAEVDS